MLAKDDTIRYDAVYLRAPKSWPIASLICRVEPINNNNSSEDEIANVNFFYDDIVHVEASAYSTPIEPTS